MALKSGTAIGAYRIEAQIGHGGMATVYRAYQASLDRRVAIKVLPDFFADDEGLRERFRLEALAVARLHHSHIVAIHDFGQTRRLTYTVSELVEGGTLADQMSGPMPVDEVTRLIAPIAAALDYAHSQKIIHRDVKPSNVLLRPDGTPLLSDFGLARMADAQRLTRTGTALGTPAYMSPEQCSGLEATAASDQYSLAIVAFEMLTGRIPFDAPTPAGVLMAQIRDPLPNARALNPALPDHTVRALARALAKSPTVRFESCTDFVRALGSPAAAAAGTPSALPRRRIGWAVAGAAAAAVLVVAGIALAARPAAAPGPLITTVAGLGTPGFSGDGGPAVAAQLQDVTSIAFDTHGDLYFADSQFTLNSAGVREAASRIRMIGPNGIVRTVAGDGSLVAADGVLALFASFGTASYLTTAGDRVYLSYSSRNDAAVIAVIEGDGSIKVLAGQPGVPASAATFPAFVYPRQLALDAAGGIVVADSGNNRVRRIGPDGQVTTLAGNGERGYSGDGGTATSAQLFAPAGVALDSEAALFIADTFNNRVRRLDRTGTITTWAGDGGAHFSGDGGRATGAGLNLPQGLAVDRGGNLYIADTKNNRVRRVTTRGVITTVAGNGSAGFAGDGGSALSAQLDGPMALAFDSKGNLYIADAGNHRIRKVAVAG